MRLGRLVSWPYIRRHAARYALLASGVALGTAVFLAMHAATRTLSAGFSDAVSAIAGQAHLQVSAGDAGIPEALLDKIQALDDVYSAVPAIEAIFETQRGTGLLVLGVDLTGDTGVRSYGEQAAKTRIAGLDPLTFIAQRDSLLVSANFARREHLQPGDRIPLRTVMGPKQFVVRGILPASPAFGGNVAVMDVYAAQAIFGRGERFDRIDVRLRQGVATDDARLNITSTIGDGFSIERPADRSAELDNLLSSYSLLQNAISLFALLLGVAMISSAFRLSVAQRRVEIGILRALGATRAQIASTFVVEGAVTGFIGALFGAAAGLALSTVMVRYAGELFRSVLPPSVLPVAQFPDVWLVAAAIAAGTLASALAALDPAIEAASLMPSEAMRAVLDTKRVAPRSEWAGAGMLAIVGSAVLPPTSSTVFYIRLGLLLIGVIACAPWLSVNFIRLVRPLLARLQPPTGLIAGDSLVSSPRRTALTIAVLTLAFAQVLVVSGVSQSAHATLAEWVGRQLDQDLLVSSSPNLINRSFQFPPAMTDRLKSIPGVAEVESLRQARVRYGESSLLMVSASWNRTCSTDRPVLPGGDWPSVCRAVSRGEGILISENFSVLSQVRAGDTMQFFTPLGPLKLPVVGVIRDFQDPRGVVYVAPSVYRRYWNDDRADKFRVFVQPNADTEQVRRAILEQLGSEVPLAVLTRKEIEQFIFDPAGRQLKASYAQIAIGGVIAVLALMNLLAISVVERRSSLAVFRALGANRLALHRMLVIEASIVACISILAGAAVGAIASRVVLETTHRLIAGVRLEYVFPAPVVMWSLPVAFAAALIASLWPAESAFRRPLAESLAYE